ncbi:hypothetical protein [Ornithinimicrobium pratense]|uniref:Uncharacterized protein n=1 Tax=Ornithinimicrobium pratense TaxID=2593973 RepID=A0A5J6V1Z0_9MICO|nr:hypothetical protein [Ornithinimicrobium pratense]QFG67688.1 hypothetical protein FY030_02150 [Ornithinimicrobium pratense]
MGHIYSVRGIEEMPVYLIGSSPPWSFSTDEFISGVPLTTLLDRLNSDENLYLVDYASVPGTARVTRLT